MKKSYQTLKSFVNWYYNRAASVYTHTPSGMIPTAALAR